MGASGAQKRTPLEPPLLLLAALECGGAGAREAVAHHARRKAELARGCGVVSAMPVQRILEKPPLECGNLLVKRKRRIAASERIFAELLGLDGRGKIVAVDAVVARRKHRALDAVLEFAHVARPRIRL